MARQPQRRGVILIALMVLLAVATAIVIGWLKLAGLERRQLRAIQARTQAEWLADSALDRARARLTADPNYNGETWKLSEEDIGGRDVGEVLIRVETIGGQASRRNVTVQADYPADPGRRNRRTKSLQITPSTP